MLAPMTEGRPLGLLVKFALPLMAGDVIQQLYTIADGMVVGRLIGLNAFAAVSAAGFFYWLLLMIVSGFSRGFGILIAQCYGAGDGAGLRRMYAMSLFLTVLIGVVLTAVCLVSAEPVLSAMNTPAEILGDSVRYIRILFAGILVTFANSTAFSVFRALGDSRTPLKAFAVSSVLNIALDIVLVLFTDLGVAAAAIATVAAQGCSALYCLRRLSQKEETRLSFSDMSPDLQAIKKLLVLGIPIGGRDCAAAVGGAVIQFIINGYGTVYIAGIAAAKKLYSLLFIIGGGMEGALASFSAQNYGARRFDRIKLGVKTGLFLLLGGLVIIIPLFLIFGRHFLGLFIPSNDPSAAAVLNAAEGQLRVCLILLPFLYTLFVFRSALQNMGNITMPLISGLLETGLRIIAVLLLPVFLGITGVYVAEAAGWPFMALQLWLAFRLYLRKEEQWALSD